MTVACTVVLENALLGGLLDVLDRRCLGHDRGCLEDVQRAARISTADVDEVIERVVGELQASTEAALVGQRALDHCTQVLARKRLEAEDTQSRQERGVDLEIRVLRGRADERDRAVLDLRQQRVLLALVEAVYLVDEEHRGRATLLDPCARRGDNRADVGDAAHHRRKRGERRVDLLGEQSGERRLARARRSPQQHRREVAALDHAPQRATLADQVLLTDELI